MKKFLLILVLILFIGCETLTLAKVSTLPKSKSCIKGDCKNGQGTLILLDGRSLKGYFKNNFLRGY